ncbi:Trehalase 1 [Theobroma cacao]|uniref:Trehalase n=1 Tax=Theobroma cacao TaxID=3641 RepID=A0A061G6V2_THECC|nr:Trehalase 1 [Theobroma cacao]
MASFQSQINCEKLFLFLVSAFFLLLSLTPISAVNSVSAPLSCSKDSGPVVPTIPLLGFLQRVQETALKTYGKSSFDPKDYVDLSLKFNLSTTVEAFDKLPKTANGSVSVKDLDAFIGEYFKGAGEDLVYAEPLDFVPEPHGFLPKVENPEVRAWALEVHALWKNLSRKVSTSVHQHPELHTMLPLPGPVVIPGSRFREVYYWDSYWVISSVIELEASIWANVKVLIKKASIAGLIAFGTIAPLWGLMASKMYATAKAIVTNLISLLDTYGHVLSGARAYYTNRSQPPLLSAMVYEIYNRTGDVELVRKSLPPLLKEYQFWNSEIHKVIIRDAEQGNHCLNRYYAMWNKPRPESSTMDKKFASKLSNDSEKQQFYRELASTAESGWDFSTRWMRNPSEFTTLATTKILPVDLNIFILRMELDIAFFAKVVGENTVAEDFLRASQTRQKAFNSVFWNEKMGQWLDFWLNNNAACEESQTWEDQNQNQNVFASNFVPLWIDLFNSDAPLVEKVMRSLQSSGLLCAAGIATSLTNLGNQWDFPNGWAPLQHMIVEGLSRSGSTEARSIAKDIAERWIRTNYVAYKKIGAMHEKYDVEKCGKYGGGGEYIPQTGFGWSNGVVLALLEEFGWPKDQKIDCN